MRIVLVRHGDADAEVPEGLQDDARALTTRARMSLASHFAPLAARVGIPDVMLMSPLVRAVQTATLLAHAFHYEGPLRATRALFPDGPVGAIEALLKHYQEQTVVLIGHQPSMGSLAAHFLGLNTFPKSVQPGTVITIDRDDDGPARGRFVFYSAVGQGVFDGALSEPV